MTIGDGLLNRKDGGLKDGEYISKPSECHPHRPLYAKGMCRSCYEKDLRQRNPEYAERQRQNCQEWCDRNRERKRAYDTTHRVKADPDEKRAWSLRRYYGMTPDEYDYMLEKQGGVCAICGREPNGRRLAVDHDHDTGTIRGLLCFRCNFGLSWFREDPAVVARASDYLHGIVHFDEKGRGE